MAITKAERNGRVHARALEQFNRIQTAVRDHRMFALKARRFLNVPGAMWEGDIGQQYENKPKYEVNKGFLANRRIYNEYKNNSLDVEFITKDGEDADQIADTCAMLYRADEQDSTADEAFDMAFREALDGGFGAFRLVTEYENPEDDDDFRQRIRFEPIPDADRFVFFDLDAKRQDKSDAKYCFVLYSMSRHAYEDEYDDDPSQWPSAIHQYQFDWLTPDVVVLAEYYEIEYQKREIVLYQGLTGETKKYDAEDLDEDELATLDATGFKEVSRKSVKKKRCHKYLMTGNAVIEDCGLIAGENIPISPVYGDRIFVDNVERFSGHASQAMDLARIKNMQLSKLVEIMAVSSTEKPIFTPEQISGHEWYWQNDNVKNFPYLMINGLVDQSGNVQAVGPAAYTRSPQVPPALAATMQVVDQDMQEVLGNHQAAEQVVSNISGKAVEMIQNRLDMQAYVYLSNMAKALRRGGQIWLSMAKEIYVEDNRKMRGVTKEGEISQVILNQPYAGEDGEIQDGTLAGADLDVTVTVGPASDSKRQAVVRAMTSLIQITDDPQTKGVLQAYTLMNMDGEGIGDLRKWARKKLVMQGVIQPTPEEQQQMQAMAQNQQPDANTLYLQAAAAQANADAQKKQADTILTMAKVDESKANALKLMGEANAQAAEGNMQLLQRFPDWHETMGSSQSEVTPEMEQAIKQSGDPHAIAYALAKRPDLAQQIAQMPPEQQVMAIGQLSQQIGNASAG